MKIGNIKISIYMKKVALFLAIAFVFGVIFTACHGQKRCAAYGEHKQYQKESIY